MRRILASSLLLSSLYFPAAAKASNPADDANATTPVHVSTGVSIPVLIGTPSLKLPAGYPAQDIPAGYRIALTLTVDENGRPQNIQLVNSYDAYLDTYVLNAVRQFRFRPGTLDNQSVPVDLNLNVEVER
jgi:TonB family protein